MFFPTYSILSHLGFVWKLIGEWNGMERNDHKGIEMNIFK